MFPFRYLFSEPYICSKCGKSGYWSIDPEARMLVCLSPLPGDNDDLCGNEADPEEIFTSEKMLLFNRLLQIFRLFPAR